MYLDGAVNFTFRAKQVTQRDMYLDRILVDFDQVGKNFDRVIRVVRQQIVEAACVALGKLVRAGLRLFLFERLPATK